MLVQLRKSELVVMPPITVATVFQLRSCLRRIGARTPSVSSDCSSNATPTQLFTSFAAWSVKYLNLGNEIGGPDTYVGLSRI